VSCVVCEDGLTYCSCTPGSGSTSNAGKLISECNQPPRSTLPGHPSMRRYNEYEAKGGNARWLGSKDMYGSCLVAGKTIVIPECFRAISTRYVNAHILLDVS